MKAGADDELGPGVDGGLGLGGGGDGAGAEQELSAVFALEFGQEFDCARDGHGDFNDRDSAGKHGLDDGVCLGGVAGAEDGDEGYAFEDLGGGFGHFWFLFG